MKGKPKVRKSKVDAGNQLFRYLREMGIGGPQLIAGHNPATEEDREEMRKQLTAAVSEAAQSERRGLPTSETNPEIDTSTERRGQPVSEEYEALAEMERRRRERARDKGGS